MSCACGSGAASAVAAATSSSLSAQTQAAASPSVSVTTSDVALSEAMLEAQLLCTTALNYRPCALVAANDTVNCLILCQGQIASGATTLLEHAVSECSLLPPEPAEGSSPACEFRLTDDSPVDPIQLKTTCNTRCKELFLDAGAPSLTRAP